MSPLKPWSPDKTEIFETLQSLWAEHRVLEDDRAEFVGGLQWKNVNGKDYLVHYFNDLATEKRRFESKGPRSPETEAWAKRFTAHRSLHQRESQRLDDQFLRNSAVAKAMKIGRAPVVIGEIFRALSESRIEDQVALSGSYAMLAYEAQARTTVPSDALVAPDRRPDLDLFVDNSDTIDVLERLLRSVDPSFRRQGHGGQRFDNGSLIVDCFTERDLAEIADRHYGEDLDVMIRFRDAVTSKPISGHIVDRSGMIAPVRVLAIKNFRMLKTIRARHDELRDEDFRLLDQKQAEAASDLQKYFRSDSADLFAEAVDPEDDDFSGDSPAAYCYSP
jgi:hypothetical protein